MKIEAHLIIDVDESVITISANDIEDALQDSLSYLDGVSVESVDVYED